MSLGRLDDLPRAALAHLPTPLEPLPNLTRRLAGPELWAKRDDCTGLGMGGNKARQLEFYVGEAVSRGADVLLITGAVQSNYVRTAAAAARKVGMDIHIQLEKRVPNDSPLYQHSGNVLLDRLYGATLHSYPHGEDEAGADRNLEAIADGLRAEGKTPYVVHLGPGHPPLGAVGYSVYARELVEQMSEQDLAFDEIIVPSGSGATHAGFLVGLRGLGCDIPVKGICVSRARDLQFPRIKERCAEIADILGIDNPVRDDDIDINDDALAPGYGKMNDAVAEAIQMMAHGEGIILDPVYSGRAMAGLLQRARAVGTGKRLLFLHTGGQPAIFGYEDALAPLLSDLPG